jgi:hypothetical protein
VRAGGDVSSGAALQSLPSLSPVRIQREGVSRAGERQDQTQADWKASTLDVIPARNNTAQQCADGKQRRWLVDPPVEVL